MLTASRRMRRLPIVRLHLEPITRPLIRPYDKSMCLATLDPEDVPGGEGDDPTAALTEEDQQAEEMHRDIRHNRIGQVGRGAEHYSYEKIHEKLRPQESLRWAMNQ